MKLSKLQYNQNYYKKHKNFLLKQREIYYKQNPWMQSYRAIKYRCNNKNSSDYKYYGCRGIKCLITKEELKGLWFRDKAYNMKKPTIDRIDNNGDYTYENCQFIEKRKNVGKRNTMISSNPILQYDLEGNFIKEWNSITEASIKMKISHSSISKVVTGKNKTAHKYIWIYKDETMEAVNKNRKIK